MPGAGVEPAHPEGYRILSPVRLPVPPPRQIVYFKIFDFDQKGPDARNARASAETYR